MGGDVSARGVFGEGGQGRLLDAAHVQVRTLISLYIVAVSRAAPAPTPWGVLP